MKDIHIPDPVKIDQDSNTEKLSKWIIFADQMYFGARSSFLNGYNLSALLVAQYALECYFKAIFSFKDISWEKGVNGHDLGELSNIFQINFDDVINDEDVRWLDKELNAYFMFRYPDALPKKEIVWKFRINNFDRVVMKIRNFIVDCAQIEGLSMNHDPIMNAINGSEQFDRSMVARRGGVHHAAVFSRFNNSDHKFKTFTTKVTKLPMFDKDDV